MERRQRERSAGGPRRRSASPKPPTGSSSTHSSASASVSASEVEVGHQGHPGPGGVASLMAATLMPKLHPANGGPDHTTATTQMEWPTRTHEHAGEDELLASAVAAATTKRRKWSPTADSTTSSDSEKRHASGKTRKPTYLVRKEEKEVLVDEIRLLESRLELLKVKAGLPTQTDEHSLAQTRESNATIIEGIHAQLLQLGGVQALISSYLHRLPVSPMNAFIHLGADHEQRRQTLRNIRAQQLRRARELVTQRLQFISETKPYYSEERFMDDDGSCHCKRFEIRQYEGLTSVEQLHNAVMYYIANMEISISETLGQLTIRENMDTVDPQIWNHRLVSKTSSGIVMELNNVGFSEFYDASVESGNQPYSVFAASSVDEDDLYPYLPHSRVRRDVTAGIMVTGFQKPDSGELVVVLKRCTFLQLYPPAFPLPKDVWEQLYTDMTAWSDVMSKFLAQVLPTQR